MNSVEISLIISNNQANQDGTERPAVKRVSDKLTTVQAFMPGRKQADGTYGPSASITVKVTGQTKVAADVALEPKSHIDVKGFFSAESYTTKDGKTRNYFTLVATSIDKTEFKTADGQAPTQAAAAPAQAPSAPAAPATPQENTNPVIPEDDDLPFL